MDSLELLLTEWTKLEPDVCSTVASFGFDIKLGSDDGIYVPLPTKNAKPNVLALIASVVENGCIKRGWGIDTCWVFKEKKWEVVIYSSSTFTLSGNEKITTVLTVYLDALKGGTGNE